MVDDSLKISFELLRQQNLKLEQEKREALKNGGGGGRFDGMEPRIAKLESGMTDIKVSLSRIEESLKAVALSSDLKELKGKVDTLPTTLQLISFVIAILSV